MRLSPKPVERFLHLFDVRYLDIEVLRNVSKGEPFVVIGIEDSANIAPPEVAEPASRVGHYWRPFTLLPFDTLPSLLTDAI